MKRVAIVIVLMVAINTSYSEVKAQDADSVLYRIEMKNGNIFIGVILLENDEIIRLKTSELGEIELQKVHIVRRTKIDGDRLRNGEYWSENSHATRYLFGTNGIGLKKGRGYYQNTWVLFNNVNYGITDNFSLGGGLIPVFLFGAPGSPVWIIPKVSTSFSEDLHFAIGGLFGGVLGEDDNFGLGLAYGVLSYGNPDHNLTFGLGFGYADGEWSDIPLITLSAMTRIKEKFYLISENYFISSSGSSVGLLSMALRWSLESFAVDFGLVRPTDVGGGFIGAPWLGVSIPFGN